MSFAFFIVNQRLCNTQFLTETIRKKPLLLFSKTHAEKNCLVLVFAQFFASNC